MPLFRKVQRLFVAGAQTELMPTEELCLQPVNITDVMVYSTHHASGRQTDIGEEVGHIWGSCEAKTATSMVGPSDTEANAGMPHRDNVQGML